MTKTRQYFAFLALPIATFLACAIFLQTKKTLWVDECYTYYGISHDNLGDFIDSICSGINFSPPLYFFLNWIIQLVFHLPIEALRVESALWISLGSLIVLVRCAKIFGFLPAFIGCTLVITQSNLLLEQALEARHYGLFFACSCLILCLFPENLKFESQTRKTLYFISLIALGMTHYLGVIFCAFAFGTRLWFIRKDSLKFNLLLPEVTSITVITTINLVMLSMQSSHLNTWEKNNSLASLLNNYTGSIHLLTILIPIIIFTSSKARSIPTRNRVKFPKLVTLSIIWFLTPLFFWIISHCSTLNLFEDRYFIPKEAAVMILISFLLQRFIPKVNKFDSYLIIKVLPLGGTLLLSISLLLLSSKRILFGLDSSLDYHHKLLSGKEIVNNPVPKLYSGDHLFFPNNYLSESNSDLRLIINNEKLSEIYRRFNSSIKTQTILESEPQPFILYVDRIIPSVDSGKIKLGREIETNGLISAYEIEIIKQE